MANIAIVDTGYLNTAGTGTKAPTIVNEVAGSGVAINLKSVTLSYQNALNVDTSPLINALSPNVISVGSTANAKITITTVLDKSDSTDMTNLGLLRDLTRTYGVKLLYYTDTADGVRDITDTVGTTDAQHLGGTIPHFHVFVTNFQVTDGSGGSHMRVTLEMIEVA